MKTTKMLAILILVLGLVGNVSGQNSPVKFRATVTANEDHDVIPVCYGDYFVEVVIDEILEDANAVLAGIASVQVCYRDGLGLVSGDNVEVYGYYWGGACPKQYCGRVQILDDSYYIMRIEEYGDNDWMVSDSNMYPIPPGNVGIGTPTPQEKLHVVGNVIIEGASPAWLNLVAGFGEDAGMSLTTMGLGVNKWEILREGTSGDLLIRETFPYPPFSGATLAVKAGSGNVGIGTTSPLWKLDVNGEIRARDQLLASNNDGAISLTPSLTYSTINAQRNFPGVQPADLLLATNGGNVGIGTMSPEERVHVVGNTIIEAEAGAGFGAPLRVVKEGAGRQLAAFFNNPRDGASEVEIQMGMGTMLPSAWSLRAASGLFSIANVAVFPPAFNIRNTGEIGIGVTSPQQKLDVDGKVRIRSFETSGGSYDVRVQSDGDLVKVLSSRRYKEDVRDLEVDFQKVLKLRPVRFKWRETAEEDIGLIAEEVDEAMEDLVVCDAEGRPDAVKYDKLGVYLLAVIKEQQQIIAALQDRIAPLEELRAQNNSLAQRVEALERIIQQYQFAVAKKVQQ